MAGTWYLVDETAKLAVHVGVRGSCAHAVTPSPANRDEDPVLAKNRIRGSVPQTKGDF